MSKHFTGSGADWCRKRERKRLRPARTPGSQKSDTCQADWRKNHFAKDSRAYRDKDYPVWERKIRKYNR